ncbi:hypothetical protein DFH11DRAFT_1549190 [Phellopilus nigrolimitatus]|nr:hypothetical protein DFH11DRAFT_1549190 [Phellopilus nigrolimitatus]
MTPGTPLEPWSVYVIFGTWTYTDDKKLGILVITDTEGIIYPCESEGETWKTEKEWLRKYLAAFRIGGDTGRVFDYGTSEASEFVITLQALRKTDDASVKSDEQVLDIQLRNVWDSFPSCRASSLSALAMHALKSTAGVKRAAAMDDSSSDSAFAQRLSGCRNPFAHSNGVLSRLPPDNIQLMGPLVQEDMFGPNYRRGDSDSSEERKERGKDWHGFNYTSRSTRQRMEKEMTNKPNEHTSMPASDAWPRPPMISGAGWHRAARAPGTVQMSLHPLGPI